MRQLKPAPTPPHFRFFCIGCERDFSTKERAAWHTPASSFGDPYYCGTCATVENQRRAG
jgi:hypothetical protein